jgi:hypothetical protein
MNKSCTCYAAKVRKLNGGGVSEVDCRCAPDLGVLRCTDIVFFIDRTTSLSLEIRALSSKAEGR